MTARFRTATWAALVLLLAALAGPARAEDAVASAFDFSLRTIDGEPLDLAEFRGKALLVVNTASFCGYTPQYADLQTVWRDYRDRGLVVLGVPSNDFNQEPGSEATIKEFCEVNFDVDFPLTAKMRVRGPNADPLYRWLKAVLGTESAPQWNFHKYLIGRDGRPVAYFPSAMAPTEQRIRQAIEAELAKAPPPPAG